MKSKSPCPAGAAQSQSIWLGGCLSHGQWLIGGGGAEGCLARPWVAFSRGHFVAPECRQPVLHAPPPAPVLQHLLRFGQAWKVGRGKRAARGAPPLHLTFSAHALHSLEGKEN